MDSARFAIDGDNYFYLEKLPVIDGLLSTGLTLFVDKDFPKYHDMTLIQYAIAKRKPKTLKLMLKKVLELNIDYKDIMYPKTSNTRGSLLRLAIEFGSKGFYDTVDNSCLLTIIEVLGVKRNDSDNTHSNILDIPLIQAIRCHNDDAIEELMKIGADFFDPLGKDKNDITDESILSEMPIMALLKLHNDKDQLNELFKNTLKGRGDDIIDRLLKLKVGNKDFRQYLQEIHLTEVADFISEYVKVNNKEKKTVEGTESNDDHPQPETETETEKHGGANPPKNEICLIDGCNQVASQRCPVCKRWFCDNHISHDETHPPEVSS